MTAKEKVRIEEFYNLRRKLWVEAMASALTRTTVLGDVISPEAAGKIADEAVAEFDGRFQATC